MALTRRAIRVYAGLSALKDQSDEDVLDALLPFLTDILRVMQGTVFTPSHIVLGVKRLYGWHITLPVADAFRQRLISKGYLVPTVGRDRKTVFVCQPPADPPADPTEVAVATAIESIIDDFEAFAPTLSNLFLTGRPRNELKDILIRFLVSLDAYGDDAMTAGVRQINLELTANSPLAELEDGGEPLTADDKYLCARFVKHLAMTNSPHLQQLSKLAAVGLLTEVVADFVRPSGVVKKSNLTIVLDAPLALDALGTSGPDIQADARNVISSLQGIGCKFIVFDTSCDEICRVLRSLLRLQPHLRHGVTHSAMLRNQVTEEFVRCVLADPEGSLEAMGVGVRHVSLHDYPNSHHHFPPDSYDDFSQGLHWYVSPDAQTHDATCMALIMRLRAGAHQRDPLACNFVFATANDRLLQHARRFCIERELLNQRHSGPVIHQRDLATAAWLRTGLIGSDVVPRGHLIAACERVLRVRTEVVERAHEVVQNVRPDRMQQLELLLRDGRSVARLMDQTLGNPAHIDDGVADRLLDDMVRTTAKQVEDEYQALIKERDLSHAVEMAQRNANLASLGKAMQEQSRQLKALENERLRREKTRSAAVEGAVAKTNRRMRLVDILAGGLLYMLAVLAIAQYVAVEMKWVPAYPLVWWASLLVTILGGYHLLEDIRQRPKRGLDDILRAVAKWMFRRQLRLNGLGDFALDQLRVVRGQITLAAAGDLTSRSPNPRAPGRVAMLPRVLRRALVKRKSSSDLESKDEGARAPAE